MKPHETAFPCETSRLSFRMAGPSCTEGMVTYWPHSAAVTEAGACGGPCQGMHEGINGGGRKAGSQSQEKGLFRFAILSKETGNAVGTLECSSATEGNDSAKTMRIGLAGQHDSESYLEEALRFAVLTLIPAHALRGLRVIVPHAHERVFLLKQYGFEPSEEGGPALFQRADRTYFDAGKGMALCGLACCVCSLNFTMMNYALVYALDNIGMAASVIIMVIQVAGSGGVYPIDVLPGIFQTLYKFMPFHYGMDMLRETIAGRYENVYWKNLAVMAGMCVLFAALGMLLYYPARPLNRLIARSKEKSGIM